MSGDIRRELVRPDGSPGTIISGYIEPYMINISYKEM